MVCAICSRSISIFRQIVACENDDFCFRIECPNLSGQFQTILPRQFDIHEDQIRIKGRHFLQCFPSISGFFEAHRWISRAQKAPQGLTKTAIILYDQGLMGNCCKNGHCLVFRSIPANMTTCRSLYESPVLW